ncbi:MAG: hypothetical protein ACKV2U_03110 [Bryobacteraceae bacterium]
MHKLILWGILIVGTGVASYAQCPATLQVGYRTVTANGRSTVIWYPTTAPESTVSYGRLNGSAAQDAAAATCARFPVVMFSHGFSGCNTQSVHITETLARRGYIVVAPNHRDASCNADGGTGIQLPFTQPETWTDGTYSDRRDDIKATLDWLLASPEFSGSADPTRIAAAGHSLGGYTSIGLTGGWPSWKDPRFKAALLLSPYLEPYLIQNRLAGMSVPALYQGGTLDITITPYIDGSKGNAYAMSGAPKLYLSLSRATHFEWTNSTCTRVASTIASCLSADANARLAVDYSSNFLDRFLSGTDRTALWSAQPGLAEFRRLSLASPVSAASYLDSTVATDSIVAAFGDAMAAGATSASSVPLPTTLGGVTVSLEDSNRRVHAAQIFFVSPRQVNFLLPADVAPGAVNVTVRNGTEIVSTGKLNALPVVPALFSAAGDGKGVPAAQSLLVKPDGSRSLDLIFTPSTLAPIALDHRAGELYIILYGTGFRRGAAAEAKIGSVTVPVFGISSTPGFFGLDQIAIGPIPAGVPAGVSDLVITVEGRAANTVKLTFK